MRLKNIPVILAILIISLAATPMMMAAPAQTACGANVTHVVAAGENMFRIALAYGTTVSAIAQANQIANPNVIYAGQTLVIPCAGQAPTTPSTPSTPAPTPLPNPYELNGLFVVFPPVIANPVALVGGETIPLTADCRRLRGTSPTDGFALGENTFYWDPATGATGYRINIYNLDRFNGRLVASYNLGPYFTNFRADLGEGYIGPGMLFAWEVQALVSDQPVCTSPRVRVYRSTTPS